jgi:hypothetical protein
MHLAAGGPLVAMKRRAVNRSTILKKKTFCIYGLESDIFPVRFPSKSELGNWLVTSLVSCSGCPGFITSDKCWYITLK